MNFVAVLTAYGNSYHIFICLENLSSQFYSLGIKLFCPWGMNCNIHCGFSSCFGLTLWTTITKSVNLNDALWAMCVASLSSAVVPQLPWLSKGRVRALCVLLGSYLTRLLCVAAQAPWRRGVQERLAAALQDGVGSPRRLKPVGDAGCEFSGTEKWECMP